MNVRNTAMPPLYRKFSLTLAAAFCLVWPGLAGAAPVVSNIRCAQLAGTKRVEVRYDVRAAGVTAVKVKLEFSANAGSSYAVPVATLSGAVGLGVPVGLDRLVVWESGQEWDQQFSTQMRVRITADDAPPTAAESGMVPVPGGTFLMGDALNEMINAQQHQVTLSPYLLGRTEVTKALWDAVAAWALPRGYQFDRTVKAEGPEHPVTGMTWLDAVVWCNARSEKEGLKLVYYADLSPAIPFRVSDYGVSSTLLDGTANGYRLPTEAEWERAARGGFTGRRFYRGNRLNYTEANYVAQTSAQYEIIVADYFREFYNTRPVGSYEPEAYGLSDMMGNVREWCQDWSSGPPGFGTDPVTNPQGAEVGTRRVLRGGGWAQDARFLRLAHRDSIGTFAPEEWDTIGFRPARNTP